jgi:hypothetical protein
MKISGIGSRDGLDHLLMRMVREGEVTRVGRGRYRLPEPVPAVPAQQPRVVVPDVRRDTSRPVFPSALGLQSVGFVSPDPF